MKFLKQNNKFGGYPNPSKHSGIEWRSVKKNGEFSVKNEKLSERSEFFSFRKILHFLAPEREPAHFLFCFFFLLCGQKKNRKLLHNNIMKLCIRMLSSQPCATDIYTVSRSIESNILLVDNLFGRRAEQ